MLWREEVRLEGPSSGVRFDILGGETKGLRLRGDNGELRLCLNC